MDNKDFISGLIAKGRTYSSDSVGLPTVLWMENSGCCSKAWTKPKKEAEDADEDGLKGTYYDEDGPFGDEKV